MSGFFDQPTASVKRPPLEAELAGLSASLGTQGRNYAATLGAEVPGTLAYGADLRSAADALLAKAGQDFRTPRSAKTVNDLWGVAENPVDDPLTEFYRGQTRKDVAGELGRYGLIGQGRGAEIMDEALTGFNMAARNQADQRRSGAATTAQNLTVGDFNLANAEAGAAGGYRQEANDALARLVSQMFASQSAGAPIAQQVSGQQAQRYALEAQPTGASPFEDLVNTALAAAAVYTSAGSPGVPKTPTTPTMPAWVTDIPDINRTTRDPYQYRTGMLYG